MTYNYLITRGGPFLWGFIMHTARSIFESGFGSPCDFQPNITFILVGWKPLILTIHRFIRRFSSSQWKTWKGQGDREMGLPWATLHSIKQRAEEQLRKYNDNSKNNNHNNLDLLKVVGKKTSPNSGLIASCHGRKQTITLNKPRIISTLRTNKIITIQILL